MGLLSRVLGGALAKARGSPDQCHQLGGGPPATETDVAMMRRAIELAREAAQLGEVPIGAVVYETVAGRVVGEAFNRREIDHDPAAHAELIAIRAAAAAVGDWRLNACTLVVTLEPCAMCAGLIVNARVGRLVYGAKDPKAGATGSLMRLTEDARLNHRVTPIGGVLERECGDLLREFFRGLRGRKGSQI
jgi:tRNA(Arg) A34 adenosine deaminase TadA